MVKEEMFLSTQGENSPKKPTIIITGANGFTGKHACDYFINKNYRVIAVTRTPTHHTSNHQIVYEHCELTDKSSVAHLIQKTKPDFLLHLAGQNQVQKSWEDPISSIEANAMSTLFLVDSLRTINPKCKIVIVSSALQFDPNHYSTLIHPYGLSKTLQSIIAQSWEVLFGMDIIIAKPSNLIGPGESSGICSLIAKKIRDMEILDVEKIIEVNNLFVRRDFLDVRDAVAAYEILFNYGKSGETYDISTGKSRYLKDITDTLRNLTTVDFKVKSIENKPEEREDNTPFVLQSMGWNPLIPFENSISDTLSYYRQRC